MNKKYFKTNKIIKDIKIEGGLRKKGVVKKIKRINHYYLLLQLYLIMKNT